MAQELFMMSSRPPSRTINERRDVQHRTYRDEFPLAGSEFISDNGLAMRNALKSRSFVHRFESLLISIGMSLFAYLLERMILRSLKKSGAKPEV